MARQRPQWPAPLPERHSHSAPALADGFALKIDDVVRGSNPRALPLAAYVDAVVAGATELDATYISRA